MQSVSANVMKATVQDMQTYLRHLEVMLGMEQPSIQDLIVTPLAGSLLGELIHFGTVQMSRNGFKWYEKAFVCIFNPMFAINNGFRYAGKITVP